MEYTPEVIARRIAQMATQRMLREVLTATHYPMGDNCPLAVDPIELELGPKDFHSYTYPSARAIQSEITVAATDYMVAMLAVPGFRAGNHIGEVLLFERRVPGDLQRHRMWHLLDPRYGITVNTVAAQLVADPDTSTLVMYDKDSGMASCLNCNEGAKDRFLWALDLKTIAVGRTGLMFAYQRAQIILYRKYGMVLFVACSDNGRLAVVAVTIGAYISSTGDREYPPGSPVQVYEYVNTPWEIMRQLGIEPSNSERQKATPSADPALELINVFVDARTGLPMANLLLSTRWDGQYARLVTQLDPDLEFDWFWACNMQHGPQAWVTWAVGSSGNGLWASLAKSSRWLQPNMTAARERDLLFIPSGDPKRSRRVLVKIPESTSRLYPDLSGATLPKPITSVGPLMVPGGEVLAIVEQENVYFVNLQRFEGAALA